MTTITINDTVDLGSLNEDEAFRLLFALRGRFGWKGTMFCDADIISTWEMYQEDDAPGITEAQLQAVRDSWTWRKGMEDYMCERGNGLVSDAVLEVMNEEVGK